MKKVVVNICRLLLAVVFIISGFVKAVDPLGSQYKIHDYLEAMGLGSLIPDYLTLTASILLSALEFCLGIFMLFAIRRRLTSRLIVALLLVMTPLTLWLALANPISDCGCFGDAIVLTNWQTFWKNIILLFAASIVARWPKEQVRFISKSNQWIVINYSALFIIVISGWSLYDLPQFDFRPYHVGANIKAGMEIPEDAEQPQFDTTFILEKDGKRQEFTADDYPEDTTWQYIDSRTVQISPGYVPPIHDFSVITSEGEDITDQLLNDSSYTFLVISPHLEQADDSRLDLLNELYEYSHEQGYPFYCLTASTEQAINRWCDMTGAEYPFCQTDEITLKTIIRSNPGVVLLKGGTVIRKWSHNNLPQIEPAQSSLPLEQLETGQMPTDTVATKLFRLLLWFVLPLALLSIADRMWLWTRRIRRKHDNQ